MKTFIKIEVYEKITTKVLLTNHLNPSSMQPREWDQEFPHICLFIFVVSSRMPTSDVFTNLRDNPNSFREVLEMGHELYKHTMFLYMNKHDAIPSICLTIPPSANTAR